MPQFSVIIPCYNSAAWLARCLDSVFYQSGCDYEVIAVDDGSADDTLSVLKNYGHGLKVLSQPNQGAGVARNLAISHSKGDYIATLDADDVWFPWTLPIYRELITRFERPNIIAGRPRHFEEDTELGNWTTPGSVNVRQYANFYEAARDGFWFLLNGALLVKRDVLQACGGFADRKINSEDTHLFMKFGMSPSFVAVKSPQLFGYRLHGANAIFNTHLNQAGCLYLISQEKEEAYPGGTEMQRIRRTMLTTHARSASIACVRAGDISAGWELYLQTFKWNVALRRFKYLFGFALLLVKAMIMKVFVPK